MKKETIKDRLQRLKINKTSAAYRLLNEWLQVPENPKIRTCWKTGTGRFCHNLDYTSDLATLLARLGVRYEIGNDAPRGGKNGNYVQIKMIKL